MGEGRQWAGHYTDASYWDQQEGGKANKQNALVIMVIFCGCGQKQLLA